MNLGSPSPLLIDVVYGQSNLGRDVVGDSLCRVGLFVAVVIVDPCALPSL